MGLDVASEPDEGNDTLDKTSVRDAATIILLRDPLTNPAVLMGQRGKKAAFMPGKFVFPGGAVDPEDHNVPMVPPGPLARTRLEEDSNLPPNTLAAAAIRELWEETGQVIGVPGRWQNPPENWAGFAATGHHPNGADLEFFFRAVTPEGRPRRFDARFFLALSDVLMTDPNDFRDASDELSHVQWIALNEARHFDLPFITQVVLAELETRIKRGEPSSTVPFFRNNDEANAVARLGGLTPH